MANCCEFGGFSDQLLTNSIYMPAVIVLVDDYDGGVEAAMQKLHIIYVQLIHSGREKFKKL